MATDRGSRHHVKKLIPAVFGEDDMKPLVQCASRALATENRYLADCFKARGWKGREYGICENQVEKYYQFLIRSELMSSFPWRPRTEYDKWDLVFFETKRTSPPLTLRLNCTATTKVSCAT
jgi:hypothetical protein